MFPRTRRSRRLWLAAFAILVVAATVALVGTRRTPGPQAATPASTSTTLIEFVPSDIVYVESHPLMQALPVTGNLEARSQAVVKAKAALEVRSIAVREGDPVRAGQVLAQLDTADLEARLLERISARDSTRAQFELAEKTRTMNNSLLERHFISQNAFDSADSSYKASHATLEAADAQVEEARIALRQATVLSPISGIVANRYVKVGERAAVDAALFFIVDLDSLELLAPVPAGEVGALKPGMPTNVSVEGIAGQTFEAKVDRISPATEPGTRSVMVFFAVPNQDHRLKSGMFASGVVMTGDSAPLATLPTGAVRMEAGQPVVWTVEGGHLARRTIQVGRRDDNQGRVEVRSGLTPGVAVVAANFNNLREGAPASLKADAKTASATVPAH